MKEIDTLAGAAGVFCECYGIRHEIRVNDPGLLAAVRDSLPPGCRPLAGAKADVCYAIEAEGDGPEGGDQRRYAVYAGAEPLARGIERRHALETLEAALTHGVATWARSHLFVHAGVVGWRGKAILIPGRSYSGKTTLVAALVRAGATYFSDEYAVIDPGGAVHPFARPLALRDANGEPAQRCSAEALGGSAGAGPLPVGLVLITEYRPGAHRRLRPVSPGRAILALLANTVPARAQPRRVLAVLRRVVAGASAVKGYRGEADDFAGTLLTEQDHGACYELPRASRSGAGLARRFITRFGEE